MMQRELYNALREELLLEFEGRISSIENQYDLLRLSYLEIIKEVHHDLGGAITTLEGLYNLEVMDGTVFKHQEMFDLAFAKADIYRKKIQIKYVDTVQLRDFKNEKETK